MTTSAMLRSLLMSALLFTFTHAYSSSTKSCFSSQNPLLHVKQHTTFTTAETRHRRRTWNEEYLDNVRRELVDLEKSMKVELQGKGLDPEVRSNESTDVGMLLRYAKLSCYFDNAHNATESFARVVLEDPGNVQARVGLAKALLARGDPAEALHHLDYLIDRGIQRANFVVVLYRRLAMKTLKQTTLEDDEAYYFWACAVLQEAATVGHISTFNIGCCEEIRRLAFVKAFLRPWFNFLFDSYETGIKSIEGYGSGASSIQVPMMLTPVNEATKFQSSVEIRFNRAYNRLEVIGDPVLEILNHALGVSMSRVVNASLVPTYAFPMKYFETGSISPHIDQLGLGQGCPVPWPLYFIDPNISVVPGLKTPPVIEVSQAMYRTIKEVHLNDNDGVLYRGRELFSHGAQYTTCTVSGSESLTRIRQFSSIKPKLYQ